jgi:hypothetical protein
MQKNIWAEIIRWAGEVVVGNKIGRTIGFPTPTSCIDETMVTLPMAFMSPTATTTGPVIRGLQM